MNRYDMARGETPDRKDPDPHPPAPFRGIDVRARKTLSRAGRRLVEFEPPPPPPQPMRRIFNGRLERDLEYTPADVCVEMLRLFRERTTLRVTHTNGTIRFYVVSENRPEERLMNIHQELTDGRLRPYEDVMMSFSQEVRLFYWLGVKRGFWGRLGDDFGRKYET